MKKPNEVIYCKNCLMPSSRPRIVFVNGICNGCRNKSEKNKINWEVKKTSNFLKKLNHIKKIKIIIVVLSHGVEVKTQL